MYDKNNVFAKIIRGEIPANKIYENENAVSFYNINPKAKVHVLVIPKGEFINFIDFNANASDKEKIRILGSSSLHSRCGWHW